MSLLRKIAPALFGDSKERETAAPPPAKKWVATYASHRFICIQTQSGYGTCAADPAGENILLEPSCSDDDLGLALRKALAASRFLTLEEAQIFFDVAAVTDRHKRWVANLMQHYKLKTRKALFADVMNCAVR